VVAELTWSLPAADVDFPVRETASRTNTDYELAQRLRAQDPQAMSEVYGRYGKLAYSVVLAIVRNAPLAEDLVQETFLRVWNRAQSFDGQRGGLSTWIVAVARNRAIDYLRSCEGRAIHGEIDVERLERRGASSIFDDRALTIDRVRRLRAAYQKLDPCQKAVIEMAYYEGLTQVEMAERLKQPLGTVKTWVRTALKNLRNELAEA